MVAEDECKELSGRLRDALAELEEWRTGKRRIVWRTTSVVNGLVHAHDSHTRKSALRRHQVLRAYMPDATIARVIIRPKRKEVAK
jgi:hypothetical protein